MIVFSSLVFCQLHSVTLFQDLAYYIFNIIKLVDVDGWRKKHFLDFLQYFWISCALIIKTYNSFRACLLKVLKWYAITIHDFNIATTKTLRTTHSHLTQNYFSGEQFFFPLANLHRFMQQTCLWENMRYLARVRFFTPNLIWKGIHHLHIKHGTCLYWRPIYVIFLIKGIHIIVSYA